MDSYRQVFYARGDGHENLIGSTYFPSFSHLRHVYALEESKVLKIAHVLKKSSLNPSSIARISPYHARGEYCMYHQVFYVVTILI